jgi:ubiquinone/menaquinone biosynthesis C-methylase UbiE
VSFEKHLNLFNIFYFKSFDEIKTFAKKNLAKPSYEEELFINNRIKADPSSSQEDNLDFYSAIGRSKLLQTVILSERYGSYVSSSSFVIKNLNHVNTVLDIGCSTGYLTSYYGLKSPKSSFIGIDFSADSIEKANTIKRELNINNVDFIHQNMNEINLPVKSFDMIIDTQSIYYSKDYFETFVNLKKIMSKKGRLITMPGIGEKKLIKKYINQLLAANLAIHDFRFIKTTNLSEIEYLPTITCGIDAPKEKIDTNHIINKLFNSF